MVHPFCRISVTQYQMWYTQGGPPMVDTPENTRHNQLKGTTTYVARTSKFIRLTQRTILFTIHYFVPGVFIWPSLDGGIFHLLKLIVNCIISSLGKVPHKEIVNKSWKAPRGETNSITSFHLSLFNIMFNLPNSRMSCDCFNGKLNASQTRYFVLSPWKGLLLFRKSYTSHT